MYTNIYIPDYGCNTEDSMNKRLSIIFLVALFDGHVLIHAENRHVSSQKTQVISTTNNQNEVVVVEVPGNRTVSLDTQDYRVKINNQTSGATCWADEQNGAYGKPKHWHIRDYIARYDKEALLELCATLWAENNDLRDALLIYDEIHQQHSSSLLSAFAYLTRLHPLKMLFLSAPVFISICLLAPRAYEYCKQYIAQRIRQHKRRKTIAI